MIKRREFGKALASGAGTQLVGDLNPLGALAQSALMRKPKRNTLMHVGGDYHSVAGGRHGDMTGKANLKYNLRHGVRISPRKYTK